MPDSSLRLIKNDKNKPAVEALGVIAHSKEHVENRHLQNNKFFIRELENIAVELLRLNHASLTSDEMDESIKALVNRAGDVVFDVFKKKTGIDTDELVVFDDGDICDLDNGSEINVSKIAEDIYVRIRRNRPYFDKKGIGTPDSISAKDLSKLKNSSALLRAWDVIYVCDRLEMFLEKRIVRTKIDMMDKMNTIKK